MSVVVKAGKKMQRPSPPLRVLDLFSGLGGIGMALRGVVKTAAYCEIEPNAAKMLENNMRAGHVDRAPVHGDVRALGAKEMKGVDMIVAGFPCTGFSVLGLREGFDNSGSSLFYEIVRLVKLARPPILFLENVSAIVRMGGLNTIIAELNGNLGYEMRWVCATGFHVGALSKRMRWFCLAISPEFMKSRPNFAMDVGKYAPFLGKWRSEPPPRLIKGKSGPGVIRYGVIGNSVMPDVVRLAFLFLASGGRVRNLQHGETVMRLEPRMLIEGLQVARKNRDGSAGDLCGAVDAAGQRVAFANPFVRQTPADFKLRFTPDGAKESVIGMSDPVFRGAWATPRRSNTSPCRVFTDRCIGDLPTQQVFEERTPVSRRTAASGYVINPEFAEWLMGLPRGSTEV